MFYIISHHCATTANNLIYNKVRQNKRMSRKITKDASLFPPNKQGKTTTRKKKKTQNTNRNKLPLLD